MAVCTDCGQEMTKSCGCTLETYDIQGKTYQRVRNSGHGVCHDCWCPEGSLHHSGCDMERCPKCGGQYISCDCNYNPDSCKEELTPMSTNVNTCTVIQCALSISLAMLKQLAEKHKNEKIEYVLNGETNEVLITGWCEGFVMGGTYRDIEDGKLLMLNKFDIHGEGSGTLVYSFLSDFVFEAQGTLQAVMAWEDGDVTLLQKADDGGLLNEIVDIAELLRSQMHYTKAEGYPDAMEMYQADACDIIKIERVQDLKPKDLIVRTGEIVQEVFYDADEPIANACLTYIGDDRRRQEAVYGNIEQVHLDRSQGMIIARLKA